MTSKVSTLLRAPEVKDPGRVDGAGTSVLIPRCPRGPSGGRSRRSTSWRSSPSTTQPRTVRRAPRCAGKARTPVTSSSGASPRRGRPGRVGGAARPQAPGPASRENRPPGGGETATGAGSVQGPLRGDVQERLHALLETLYEGADTEPRSNHDRPGCRRTRPANRRARRVRCRRRVAGRLLPAAQAKSGTAAADADPTPRPATTTRTER